MNSEKSRTLSSPWSQASPASLPEALWVHRHSPQSSCGRSKTAQSRAHGFCRASQMPRVQPPSCNFLRPDVKLGIFRGSFHPSRHPVYHVRALSWTVTEEGIKAEKALCNIRIKRTKKSLFSASPPLPLSLCTSEKPQHCDTGESMQC